MRTRITRNLRPILHPGPHPGQSCPQPSQAPPTSDYDLSREMRPPRPLTEAAVLVPIVTYSQENYQVLLTQRTEHLNAHAGQISFPGGRAEADDHDAVATALRETHEEVGIDSDFIEVVGLLDDYETVTGYRITPVVSFVRPGFALDPDPFEVAEAFEVPLNFLLDPDNHQTHSRVRGGERRNYYVFEYGERYIWGATAGMLMNLYRRIREPEKTPRSAQVSAAPQQGLNKT